jgi:hypothetical protein
VVPNFKNPPKNKLTQGDFTSFSMQDSAYSHNFCFRLPELHIQNLSNRCRHKNDPSISHFWRDFAIRLNCATLASSVFVASPEAFENGSLSRRRRAAAAAPARSGFMLKLCKLSLGK